MTSYRKLKHLFNRISHLHYIQRIMQWDEAVMMPEGAGVSRANALATLNVIAHKKLISKKVLPLIEAAKDENLSSWDAANLKWMKKRYLTAACISSKLTEQITKATMASEQVWRKLREKNNWKEFLPYLEKTFSLVKEAAERKSAVLGLNPYDALLDEYASGFNQNNINDIFAGLKKSIPTLLQQIVEKQKSFNTQKPQGPFAIEKQKQLGLTLMRALQFDFNHGRLDVSHHPFCGGDSDDVRITTRYNEDEFMTSLFGICHETGHALYEQGLPREWITQPVGKVENMAMHESQSLLIEMELCRSPAFFHYLAPLVEAQFGNQDAMSAENLSQLMMTVKPGFIRVDADEVTYPMHIILRYEIEKSLFNGELAIKDLPARWNELMTDYLGLSTLGNDKNGVMQDVHWPAGAFGYFPAYTLGRMIAAQLFATFEKSHPRFHDEVKQGNFVTLRNWLKKQVHEKASSVSVNELLTEVTGEPLNSAYFVERIKQRYLMSG